MTNAATSLIQSIDNGHLTIFANRLSAWLIADLNKSREEVPDFTESRARALLRATEALDDPTLHSFARLLEHETGRRLALYDLLEGSGLAENDEVAALLATSAAAGEAAPSESSSPVSWLALSVAAFAWKSGYPLYQLDPASPPDTYSPAGQLIKRAAYFVRRQVLRSATERGKLGRQLAFNPAGAAPGASTLETLSGAQPIAPLPPHFRPPIPVRYPEVSRETLRIEPEDEEPKEAPAAGRGTPITIRPSDLPAPEVPPAAGNVTTMPPIQIREEQLRPEVPPPRSQVVTPRADAASRSSFSDSVRQMLGREREAVVTTKLRVVVQEYADGPGLYGLQVRISCKGVRSYVAGTTNRDGHFLSELPIRLHSGLTYDVDVTWPRDMGGETERKSITLNADRTEFVLPFYYRMKG